ncbi:RNA polymerase sigma-70 factor (ECF subfamily) [Kordia periserrulae]|uniref:RNA polymerase sigma-70 factor (ECF subfamily) n=1 Tax=Kordia periserrulae TaxID=701523 RepID=A0A2T6C1R0_9FLAO|nr:RNA polymerase sigma-70 factor [Kordia periserrulae]PTX62260.1 RNA polymerase sigma-70 factor (ECF subfamily) [Kordia periserrulae]
MTTEEIVNSLKTGSQETYKLVYFNHHEWLCNYIYKLSHDYYLSEDIVQEVFLRIWLNRESLHIKSSIKSYLFRSCHNEYLQYLRKQKVKTDFLEKLRVETIFEMYDNEDFQKEYANKLESVLKLLPPKCKEVFIQAKLDKKKYKDIAEDLNISVKTVEGHMTKALKIIKTQTSVAPFLILLLDIF